MFAISDKATGRSIGLMFLTDDMFRGVRCFKTVKLEYSRSWMDLEKDNCFFYSEEPWRLCRPFIPRCWNLETNAKEGMTNKTRAVYFYNKFIKKIHTLRYVCMHMIIVNYILT